MQVQFDQLFARHGQHFMGDKRQPRQKGTWCALVPTQVRAQQGTQEVWRLWGIATAGAIPVGRGPETNLHLVDGGDAAYPSHWLREPGLSGLLPSLTDPVW
jgi:hypothetical protein